MPTVLNVPSIIISSDIARQVSRRAIHGLCMEDRVALSRIVGIVESSILLNDAAAVGIVRRALVKFVRLKIKAASELMRAPCVRNVVGDVAGDCSLLSGTYRHRG